MDERLRPFIISSINVVPHAPAPWPTWVRQLHIQCLHTITSHQSMLSKKSEPTAKGVMADSHAPPRALLDSNYARDKRTLMELMNKLRSTGVNDTIDLPTVAVVGNQSSGKSSLIEAISGITLPRASGTCTKVPIEVRLRQKDTPWQCAIKIRTDVSNLPKSSDDGRAAKPVVEQFLESIRDPTRVPLAVRQAQDKALSIRPSTEPLKTASVFSRNVVVLEITGPQVTDLTLIDLPGTLQDIEEFAQGDELGQSGQKSVPLSLEQVRARVEDSITRDLPGNTPFAVKAEFMHDTMAGWGNEASGLQAKIVPLVKRAVEPLIEEYFGKYSERGLHAEIRAAVAGVISRLAENTRAQIEKQIRFESRPFTMDEHYYRDSQNKVFAQLKLMRARVGVDRVQMNRRQAGYHAKMTAALDAIRALGNDNVRELDLAKLIHVADWESELRTMAEVRAYWQVAYKRIIDSIPQVIDHELIQPAPAAISSALLERFFGSDDATIKRCRLYMQEPEGVSARRSALNATKAMLVKATEALDTMSL